MSTAETRDGDNGFRCPACRARQALSAECRRCGADLSLLRDVRDTALRERAAAIEALRAGLAADALAHARRAHALLPAAETVRLRRICRLAEAVSGRRESGRA